MVRLFKRRAGLWLRILAVSATLGALELLGRTRAGTLEIGSIVRIDALSAFFIFATLGGASLAARFWQPGRRVWRHAVIMLLLIVAYSTPLTPAIALGYMVAAALMLTQAPYAQPGEGARHTWWRRALPGAPDLLAATCLLIGYGALALRGAIRYDDRMADAPLDSFVFWFVLLAAIIPVGVWRWWIVELVAAPRAQSHQPPDTRSAPGRFLRAAELELLGIAWLYPLARLYSLGPWNTGWSYAAALLGGAAAGWCALAALTQADPTTRAARGAASSFGMALAGLGLGTSAGLAAGCYGALAFVLVVAGHGDGRRAVGDMADRSPMAEGPSLTPWLLSAAIPLTAPFVAAWMLMGAAVAGGVALLAGVAWLVALINGIAMAAWRVPATRRPAPALAIISLASGVGAPLIVRRLIQPVVEQLQGGLTPYGELNVWPWVGLAASDAAHTQVTTLPSLAIGLLMLVLCALVYSVARLREAYGGPNQRARPAGSGAPAELARDDGALLRTLRADVPWLDALLGARRRRERQPGDSE